MRCSTTLLAAALGANVAGADPAMVEGVEASATAGTWRFSVTLRHGDTGWDDYADGWRVEALDGTVLGYRKLFHPHVEEQPFTRSLQDVPIPHGTRTVAIRARTSTEGWSADTTLFDLPR